MENKQKTSKIIVIDADVVSHFLEAGEAQHINKIFPYPIKILPQVLTELRRFKRKEKEIEELLRQAIIEPIPFPDSPEIEKEYQYIKGKMFKGDGESACLAFARYSKNIIASSNLRDIKIYCEMHEVAYLTTFDFLCEALKVGLFDANRCDEFIRKNLSKRPPAAFPATSMSQFTCRDLSKILKDE